MRRCSPHQSVLSGTTGGSQDEIARTDRPNDLQKMISRAVVIDNRQYERRLEKGKGPATSVVLGRKSKKGRRQPYYGPQPMELDATRKVPTNARGKTAQQSKACYTCGKLGHFSKDCTQNKYKNKPKPYDKASL